MNVIHSRHYNSTQFFFVTVGDCGCDERIQRIRLDDEFVLNVRPYGDNDLWYKLKKAVSRNVQRVTFEPYRPGMYSITVEVQKPHGEPIILAHKRVERELNRLGFGKPETYDLNDTEDRYVISYHYKVDAEWA